MPRMGDLAAQDNYDTQYAPYGVGSPAESADAPSGMGALARGAYEYLGDLAKRSFGASEEMRQGGAYNPAPIMEAAMLPMTGAVAGTGPGGFAVGAGPIKAYHSSPHDFDKFDLAKIGSGEGAQVYGHGLYFAENPAVSGQGGQYWNQFQRRFEGPEALAAEHLKAAGFDRAKAIAKLQESGPKLGKETDDLYRQLFDANPPVVGGGVGDYTKAVRLLESGKPVGPRTYEVNINADPAHMLDWDKALTEQHPKVQEALRANYEKQWGFQNIAPYTTGDKLYQSAAGRQKNRSTGYPASTAALAEAGIPGIKYLDEGSRGASPYNIIPTGQGNYIVRGNRYSNIADAQQAKAAADAAYETERTRNYVMFDPATIDIMKKYGLAGATAGTMGALAAQDNYQPEEKM